jgi:ATP-binding cassette, subfamily B, bacterial MsbA
MRDLPPVGTTVALARRMIIESWRTYASRYVLAFLLMGMAAGATGLSAYLMKDVINQIFVDRDQRALVWIPSVIVVVFIVKGFASYYQEVILSRIGNSIVADTQKRMFAHMLDMNVNYYLQKPSNELITQFTVSANAARSMLNFLALAVGRDLLTLVSLIVVMISVAPVMSLVVLVAGPIAFLGVRSLLGKVQRAARSEVVSTSAVVGTMRETAQGIRLVKSYQLEPLLQSRMYDAIDAVARTANKIAKTQARINPLIETIGGLSVAIVVFYAGWRTISLAETPGQFFAFITALLMAADPARRLSRVQLQLGQATVGVQMMYDLLDAPTLEPRVGVESPLIVSRGAIEFRAVAFSYAPGTNALNGLDLLPVPGGTTALVGSSGGGKSTAFSLLQRLWVPNSGHITIDGRDLQDVSLESLRRQIALVSQDTFLFDGSIGDNIRAAKVDATMADIERAARAAHADAFIRQMPNGYDTPVGELGSQLSGGQRQRISIARAFLKDAPIILLDEPTSALDAETEGIIQDALAELTKGRTTLVIAHRLATILRADQINVIEHGKVVESGTHAELLRAGNVYAKLFRMQFGQHGSPAVFGAAS